LPTFRPPSLLSKTTKPSNGSSSKQRSSWCLFLQSVGHIKTVSVAMPLASNGRMTDELERISKEAVVVYSSSY
jgi:hypothetical protein